MRVATAASLILVKMAQLNRHLRRILRVTRGQLARRPAYGPRRGTAAATGGSVAARAPLLRCVA